jgi:hypothetical protein
VPLPFVTDGKDNHDEPQRHVSALRPVCDTVCRFSKFRRPAKCCAGPGGRVDLADTADRYYVVVLIGADTNSFAYFGRRAIGTKARRVAIVGPDIRKMAARSRMSATAGWACKPAPRSSWAASSARRINASDCHDGTLTRQWLGNAKAHATSRRWSPALLFHLIKTLNALLFVERGTENHAER